jgi:hypothetical protein
MHWTKGELRDVSIGIKPPSDAELTWSEYRIPAPYDRIIAQLLAEIKHARTDKAHEALRRQSYARRVLNSFFSEFRDYDGKPEDYRSQVLTPILQRQLAGVEGNYSASMRSAIGGMEDPTIQQATLFYLSKDPTDPRWIPNYRRSLIYIPEARWHLATVVGAIKVGDKVGYRNVQRHHDNLMQQFNDVGKGGGGRKGIEENEEGERGLEGNEHPLGYSEDAGADSGDSDSHGSDIEMPENSIARFSACEVDVILTERLGMFFGEELRRVVCPSPHPPILHIP